MNFVIQFVMIIYLRENNNRIIQGYLHHLADLQKGG
jgi:hypothetical protein